EGLMACWHDPPYTHGSHTADGAGDSGGRMRDMREVFLPVLEQAGVDLVLNGHSHVYERSFLLDGHYGVSSTLTPEMKLDSGGGRFEVDGAYSKTPTVPTPHLGTVYTVAGSGSLADGVTLD